MRCTSYFLQIDLKWLKPLIEGFDKLKLILNLFHFWKVYPRQKVDHNLMYDLQQWASPAHKLLPSFPLQTYSSVASVSLGIKPLRKLVLQFFCFLFIQAVKKLENDIKFYSP